MQEAYRPSHSKYSFCCPDQGGYPHLDLAKGVPHRLWGYPIPLISTWLGGLPHPWWEGVPQLPPNLDLAGGYPSYLQIWTWLEGVPYSWHGVPWGTHIWTWLGYPHLQLSGVFPPSGPSWGTPPHPRLDGVPPHLDLAGAPPLGVDRLKT